jgi:hypothetical protein
VNMIVIRFGLCLFTILVLPVLGVVIFLHGRRSLWSAQLSVHNGVWQRNGSSRADRFFGWCYSTFIFLSVVIVV